MKQVLNKFLTIFSPRSFLKSALHLQTINTQYKMQVLQATSFLIVSVKPSEIEQAALFQNRKMHVFKNNNVKYLHIKL